MNTKNYNEQGGEKTVINGQIEITQLGKLTFDEVELKPCELVADSTASTVADVVTDFNNLLAGLKAAGIMKSQ